MYHRIKHMIEKDSSQEVAAINFIEFIGDTQTTVDNKTAGLEKLLLDDNKIYHLTEDTAEMNSLWELRKKELACLVL